MCTNNHALYTRLVMNRLFLGLQSKCIRWYLCMDRSRSIRSSYQHSPAQSATPHSPQQLLRRLTSWRSPRRVIPFPEFWFSFICLVRFGLVWFDCDQGLWVVANQLVTCFWPATENNLRNSLRFFLQVYLMICSNSFSAFGGPGSDSAPVLILCGGFLGAGKTTAITALARKFMQNGRRAALIVNDQAGGLVDQASALATGSPAVGEVAGGCFCCKLSALTETLNQLGKDHHPDVFFAEPVGSCTDIVATVVLPLREIYGERAGGTVFSAGGLSASDQGTVPRGSKGWREEGILEERFLYFCEAA